MVKTKCKIRINKTLQPSIKILNKEAATGGVL